LKVLTETESGVL